jgi:ABC-type multidrug transport system ATPase subunit
VSFTVSPGEVVGLVGPNGAGKTTLLKIVASLLEPTVGRVSIAGYDIVRRRREACRRMGLVLEGDRGIYDRLTGRENLEFFGVMAGLTRTVAGQRADVLLDELGLADRDKLAFGYSAGMRMRLSIARALLADPPVLVLDEPTRSLDPLASRMFEGLVGDLARRGHAVLLSNHRLDEVARLCTSVVVLVDGGVRYQGAVDSGGDTGHLARTLADLLEREAAG